MSVTQSLVACLNNCDFSYIPITSCLLKQINKYFCTFSLHVMFHCLPLLCKLWPLYTAREALGRAAGFCYPYNVLCVGDWRKVQYISMIGLSFPFSSLCKDPSGAKKKKKKWPPFRVYVQEPVLFQTADVVIVNLPVHSCECLLLEWIQKYPRHFR